MFEWSHGMLFWTYIISYWISQLYYTQSRYFLWIDLHFVLGADWEWGGRRLINRKMQTFQPRSSERHLAAKLSNCCSQLYILFIFYHPNINKPSWCSGLYSRLPPRRPGFVTRRRCFFFFKLFFQLFHASPLILRILVGNLSHLPKCACVSERIREG